MKTLLFALCLTGCGTKTICATREAQKLDPNMNDSIAEAVAYWEDRGYSGLTATDGFNCDVPVRPASMKPVAHAQTIHTVVSDDCWPDFVEINPDRWDEVIERDARTMVLAHEVGHLHCLDDANDGEDAMSLKWHE